MDWAIIIAVALVVGRIGKRFGQPITVGEILAGILLGPSGLGLIWPASRPALFPADAQQILDLLGKLGVILLLFQVGMELDFGHFRRQSGTVISVSAMGIILPMAGGLMIGGWLHGHFAPEVDLLGFQLFVCVAMSITALPVLGRILLELKLERTALGALAASAAAIDDVVGWLGLAAVTALVTSKFHWLPLLGQAVSLILFFLFLMKLGGPALRQFWKRSIVRAENGHAGKMPFAFLAVLLTCLFGCCLVTNKLGMFSIFGAFLLGIALHEQQDLAKAWREQLSNFVLVALVPIFFTSTGLRTEIGSLNTAVAWEGCVLVFGVGATGKLLGCWAAAKMGGQTNRVAIAVAALMNTRGLMGLVAINVGYELGLLPKALFTMLVIMSLATTAMTGPLLKLTGVCQRVD